MKFCNAFYILNFKYNEYLESNYAYRYCLSDGSWFKNENSTWNNNKDCKFFTNETLEEMDGYIIIDVKLTLFWSI